MNAALLLATLATLAEPTSTPATDPAATTAKTVSPGAGGRGRVLLLRGTGVVFSPGFRKLADDLRLAGFSVEDLCSFGDHWACRRLIEEQRDGRLSGPIILVGHSRGGRHALDAAHRLQAVGIMVDLLVCLDVAFPAEVPANVKQVLNLYMTQNRLYPARPLKSGDAGPRIENVDLNAPGSPVDGRGLIHVTITASPAVRDYVLQRILLVVQGGALAKAGVAR